MKNLKNVFKIIALSMTLMVGFTIPSQAQFYVSATSRSISVYNEETEEWEGVSSSESINFFKFNEDFTILEHTTESMTSSYMLTATRSDKEKGRYTFEAISDAGNTYTMQFRLDEEEIVFFYESDGDYYAVFYPFKNFWKEDENS